MKKVFAALGLVAILLFMWGIPVSAWDSQGNNQVQSWGTSFFYKIGSGTVMAQLIAGKTGEVGTVTVWESASNLKVKYDLFDGWNLTETALHVGRGSTCDKAENKIPQNRMGNYDPDKFKYQNTFDQLTITYIYTINEGSLGSGNWLCIAAYANVQNIAHPQQLLDAWGDLKPVGKWKLPTDPITMQILIVPGSNMHYLNLALTNVGTGYSIANGTYSGWCADQDSPISGKNSANVYSSLNLAGAPARIKDIQWDKINYILNHHDPAPSDPMAATMYVQFAIWHYTDNYDCTHILGSQLLVDDAEAHGMGFIPGPGQIGAVIIDPGDDIQPIFIELFVPSGCFKEGSCRYNCNPGWSPCQKDWEPDKSSCHDDWNPCSTTHHFTTTNFTNRYNWDSKCTPKQNLDHFINLWSSK